MRDVGDECRAPFDGRNRAGATEEPMAGRQDKARRRGGSFDARDLARRRASVAGSFDVASLPRTADRLATGRDGAQINWRITGIVDASGRSALEVRLDGMVQLVCQR